MEKIQVIVAGAGPAGLAAAESASSAGANVLLIGAEPYLPYWRPRLTAYLSAPAEVEKYEIRKPDWFVQRGISLLTGRRVVRVDPAAKQVALDDGTARGYDALVLATGAYSFLPQVPGAEHPLALRSYDDAVHIREAAVKAGRAVVIGGGLLGLETAWELNEAGVHVHVIEIGPWLMARQLDEAGARCLEKRLTAAGIAVHTNGKPEQFQQLFLGSCVVLAAGVRPDLSALEGSGVAANKAVIVDDHMRTSAPGVYACGDMAEFKARCWGLLPVAQEQGRVAGANAAGGEAVYAETPPSPMLKVGSCSVFSVGDVSVGDGVTALREETDAGYACALLTDSVLTGAVLVGNTAAGMKLKKAVAEKRRFVGVTCVSQLLQMV